MRMSDEPAAPGGLLASPRSDAAGAAPLPYPGRPRGEAGGFSQSLNTHIAALRAVLGIASAETWAQDEARLSLQRSYGGCGAPASSIYRRARPTG
jgi:hypothetical protein